MNFTDSHVHLDDDQFDAIRAEVIDRAVAAGVSRMITIGTNAPTSRKCANIATEYTPVYAAVGIQPNYASEVQPNDWDDIVALAKAPKVVAIGETGLDHYWDYAPIDLQEEYFNRHLELSRETGLPFIVHMRDPKPEAVDEGANPLACSEHIYRVLKAASNVAPLNGVMHSYSGNAEYAEKFLELGMYVSFAGMVTYKKSDDLRSVAKLVPSNRLLIETDAPYLSPHPKRSHRPNEPALMLHTAECIAKVRGISMEEMASITTENAESLFRFDRFQ